MISTKNITEKGANDIFKNSKKNNSENAMGNNLKIISKKSVKNITKNDTNPGLLDTVLNKVHVKNVVNFLIKCNCPR